MDTQNDANNCTNVDLDEFWRRCQMQIVYSKVHNLLESVDAQAFHPSSFVNNVIYVSTNPNILGVCISCN